MDRSADSPKAPTPRLSAGLSLQRASHKPLIAPRICDAAIAIAVRLIGRRITRRRTRADRALIDFVAVRHVQIHHRGHRLRPFVILWTAHSHDRVPDSHRLVHASRPLVALNLLTFESLLHEVDEFPSP